MLQLFVGLILIAIMMLIRTAIILFVLFFIWRAFYIFKRLFEDLVEVSFFSDGWLLASFATLNGFYEKNVGDIFVTFSVLLLIALYRKLLLIEPHIVHTKIGMIILTNWFDFSEIKTDVSDFSDKKIGEKISHWWETFILWFILGVSVDFTLSARAEKSGLKRKFIEEIKETLKESQNRMDT